MTGSVRKRGDKWYYSFEAASIDGKRKRIEKVGGKTKKEAQEALRKAIIEYENHGFEYKISEMSVSDYFDQFLAEYKINLKENTYLSYEQIIRNHIKPFMGKYKLKTLSPAVLQKFIDDKYLQGYSKNYINGMHGLLTLALSNAVYPKKYIKENPMQYVTIPKFDEKEEIIILSKENLIKIFERFPKDHYIHIALKIGYHTGMRISEVVALTWDDIDLENKTIDVNKILHKKNKELYFGTPKTKTSYRTISIDNTLYSTLIEHKKMQLENELKYGVHYREFYEIEETISGQRNPRKSLKMFLKGSQNKIGIKREFVCKKEFGEVCSPDTIKHISKIINNELGINFNFHALRHTHATMLIEAGANMKDVQKRLGHSNIATTMDTYVSATKKMAQETANIFEKISILPTT